MPSFYLWPCNCPVKLHLPLIPVADVLDLPDLVRALVYASGKIVTRRKSEGDIEAAVARVGALRSLFLDQAVVLLMLKELFLVPTLDTASIS